jgi:hypothetical protein
MYEKGSCKIAFRRELIVGLPKAPVLSFDLTDMYEAVSRRDGRKLKTTL